MTNIINLENIETILTTSNVNGDFYGFFDKINKRYQDTKDLFPINKVHEELTRIQNEKKKKKPMNSKYGLTGISPDHSTDPKLIITVGNFGLSDENKDYYLEMLSMYEKYLADKNITILITRGNGDNPQYFTENPIDTGHIKTIPDYSVIQTKEHSILCVGGGISIDRSWKQKNNHSQYFGKSEEPFFSAELMEEIASNYKIDTVVSQTAPSFIGTGINENTAKWCELDEALHLDITKVRLAIDSIYASLLVHDLSPEQWILGTEANADTTLNSITFRNCDNILLVIYQPKSSFAEKLESLYATMKAKKIRPTRIQRGGGPGGIVHPGDLVVGGHNIVNDARAVGMDFDVEDLVEEDEDENPRFVAPEAVPLGYNIEPNFAFADHAVAMEGVERRQ